MAPFYFPSTLPAASGRTTPDSHYGEVVVNPASNRYLRVAYGTNRAPSTQDSTPAPRDTARRPTPAEDPWTTAWNSRSAVGVSAVEPALTNTQLTNALAAAESQSESQMLSQYLFNESNTESNVAQLSAPLLQPESRQSNAMTIMVDASSYAAAAIVRTELVESQSQTAVQEQTRFLTAAFPNGVPPGARVRGLGLTPPSSSEAGHDLESSMSDSEMENLAQHLQRVDSADQTQVP